MFYFKKIWYRSCIFSEKDVREHLRSVYGTLAIGLVAATVGASFHLFTDILRANFFLTLGSILLMIALSNTPHTVYNERKRLMYLLGFCVCSGELGLDFLIMSSYGSGSLRTVVTITYDF